MSRSRRNQRTTAYEKGRHTGGAGNVRHVHSAYAYESTARKMEIVEQPEEQPWRQSQRQPQPQIRKNRERARHMSGGYVVFLVAALCTAGLILVNYIQMQARLTNLTKSVASMESQLNSLKIANDEAYNKILNSIDLEEVKRIAIGELGMVYAEEGQIITYTNEGSDYMRRATGNSR